MCILKYIGVLNMFRLNGMKYVQSGGRWVLLPSPNRKRSTGKNGCRSFGKLSGPGGMNLIIIVTAGCDP